MTQDPNSHRKHPLALSAVVFLLSASLLAYEIALMRILAITQWSHSAYLVISVALLGFGASGTLVALGGQWLRRRERVAIPILAVVFAGAMPLCHRWAQTLDFNVLELPWRPAEAWTLMAMALILMIPFVAGAGAIVLAISSVPRRSTSIYAANLLGSGAGAWGAVGLLWLLDAEFTVVILFLAGLLAATVAAYRARGWAPRVVWLTWLAGVSVMLTGVDGLGLRISEHKPLPKVLLLLDARRAAHGTSPMGRIDVIASPAIHEVPGAFLLFSGRPPPQMLILTDAGGPSPVNLWRSREDLQCFDATTAALPYHVRRPNAVCVIGAGGGTDIDLAYYHGASRIHAVELNPRVLDVLSEARGSHGQPYHQRLAESLTVVVAEGRGYLARTPERFDLIQIALLDSFSASSAGVYALNESYLYTVEALQAYVHRLTPDGVLAITRWLKPARPLAEALADLPAGDDDPQRPRPRDAIKLLATAVEALEALGPSSTSSDRACCRHSFADWTSGARRR